MKRYIWRFAVGTFTFSMFILLMWMLMGLSE